MKSNILAIKLFEDCRVVRGSKRSIIYDLGRKKYEIISNQQADWIKELDKTTWNLIQQLDNKSELKQFVDYLLDKEYIFLCNKDHIELFPPLEEVWDYPATISNAIIIRSSKSTFDFDSSFKELENIGCRHLQLILTEKVPASKVKGLLLLVSRLAFKSVEIILTSDTYNQQDFNSIKILTAKLLTVYITNSLNFKLEPKSSHQSYNAIFLTNDINEVYKQHAPDPNYFIADIQLFMESLFHNTFFNKKVIIDDANNILNSLNGASFGSMGEVSLDEIVNNIAFQTYWNVSKNEIEPCSHCEFRHMCVDSRPPVKASNGWIYETPCNYNPMKGKWNWESTESVKPV